MQEKAQGAVEQALSQSQGHVDQAKQQAAGLQEQAEQHQQQGADYVKSTGNSVEAHCGSCVNSASKAANAMSKNNLPEGAQDYAGPAVDYANNLATGAVDTVAGGLKNAGDTVGNAGKAIS